MKHSPASSSRAKKMDQDECCGLYREYCYPCTIDAVAETPKVGGKKVGKSKKRDA